MSLSVRRMCTGWWCASVTLAVLFLTETAYSSLIKEFDLSQDSLVSTKDTIEGVVYDLVGIPGYELDRVTIGAPQLPLRGASFIIPCLDKLSRVDVTMTLAETLPGPYNLKPVQAPGCSLCGPQYFTPPAPYYYNCAFPLEHIENSSEGCISSFRVASFNLRPLRCLPDGRIIRALHLSVTVVTSPAPLGFEGLRSARRSEFCRQQLTEQIKAVAENPEDTLWAWPVPVQQPTSPLEISDVPALDRSYVDCVIVTEDAAVEEWQPYARFWTERGVVSTVRGLSWIEAHFPGCDRAERIREFIKAAHLLWGTGFAILAGWQSGTTPANLGVPTRLVPNGASQIEPLQGWATTDHYYADLEGTWDENHNGVFGEPYIALGTSSMYFGDENHGCCTTPAHALAPPGTHAFWTENGGQTWNLVTPDPWGGKFGAYDMCLSDANNGWCIGYDRSLEYNVVFRTSDGGRTWFPPLAPLPQAKNLRSIYCATPNTVWVAGSDDNGQSGLVVFTTDGGFSWVTRLIPGIPNLQGIEFDAAGVNGWIAAAHDEESGLVVHSADGGYNWSPQRVGEGKVSCVSFADAVHGWAAGSPPGTNVWHTEDGGENWVAWHAGISDPVLQICAHDPAGSSISALAEGRLYAWNPGILQWQLCPGQEQGRSLTRMCFVGPSRGWCSGTDSLFASTWDGGQTWTRQGPVWHFGDESVSECLPEVLVGRLPTIPNQSVHEEGIVLDKLIRYQCDPPRAAPPTFLKRTVFAAWFGQLHHEAIQGTLWWPLHGLQNGKWELYEPLSGIGWEGDDNLTRQNVVDALNQGFHFIGHDYHAGPDAWDCYDRPYLTEEDIRTGTIYNGDTAGIAWTIGCHGLYLIGGREDIKASMGRAFLMTPHGGSVAYAGASIMGSGGEYPTYLYFLEQVYGFGRTRAGVAHSNAVTWKRGIGVERIVENLLGDPLMDIWTAVPDRLLVQHPATFSPMPGPFDVTVTDTLGVPVGGATVCIAMWNPVAGAYDPYSVGETDANGRAHFDIDPKYTGEMTVTVVKHDYLPYKGTCHIGLFSNNPEATANNQQRNLARVAGSGVLHVVYASNGTVWHSESHNDGLSWVRPTLVDMGEYPTITLNYRQDLSSIDDEASVVRDEPWIVYEQGDDIRAAIFKYGQPPVILTLFDGNGADSTAGPPVCAACPTASMLGPAAWAAYAVTYSGAGATTCIQARLFNVLNVLPAYVVSDNSERACSHPSIAITPGDIVHLVWEQADPDPQIVSAIKYSEFRIPSWTTPCPISGPLHPNSHNPFVDAYGDSAKAAWSSPLEHAEVYTSSHWINAPPPAWLAPSPASNSPLDQSDWPVVATTDVTGWQENVSGQSNEVFVRIRNDIHNISNTPKNSNYPSMEAYSTAAGISIDAVWTEDWPGAGYEVKFARYFSGYQGGTTDAASYLAVKTGDSTPSPYCSHRTGAIRLGQYALDYGADSLKYVLPYLDPQYDYWVRAIAYQQTRQSWAQRFRLGDSLGQCFSLTPGKPETLWARLPVKFYWRHGKSALAAFRLQGQYSLATRFAIFQLDPQRGSNTPRGGGGGMAVTTMPLRAILESPAPNPFSERVHLTFFLNRSAKASLTIYDAAGRVVRTLARGEFAPGVHHLAWNSRTAANGIYFARLETESITEVRKLILTR